VGGKVLNYTAEADAWVRSTYAPALDHVADLTPDQRAQIARGLSRYTGISVSSIDRRTLQITPRQFREGLLRDESKTLAGQDLRSSTPIKRLTVSVAAQRYLKYEMGYRTDLPYFLGLEPRDIERGFAPSGSYPPMAGSNWNYATSPVPPEKAAALLQAAVDRGAGPPTIGDPLPATEEAIQLNPNLKVLVIIARYDGESTCPSNFEVQKNLPPQLQRAMTFKCYESGHGVWRTPGVIDQLRNDALAMMRSAQ
jgi:hypothetical protein